MQLLQEIKSADKSEVERDQIFQSLLSKLTSIMPDRAAVMKSFDQELENFLQSELGDNANLQFFLTIAMLFFPLLGLSGAHDTALGTIEDDFIQQANEKLGRDSVLDSSISGRLKIECHDSKGQHQI